MALRILDEWIAEAKSAPNGDTLELALVLCDVRCLFETANNAAQMLRLILLSLEENNAQKTALVAPVSLLECACDKLHLALLCASGLSIADLPKETMLDALHRFSDCAYKTLSLLKVRIKAD